MGGIDNRRLPGQETQEYGANLWNAIEMASKEKLAQISATRSRMAETLKDHGFAAWPILNYGPDPEWNYVEGFSLAADVLIDHILKFQTHPDQLVFPTVFVFRHSVELRLKRILRLCRDLGAALPKMWKSSHNLGELWLWARPTVEKECSGIDLQAADQNVANLASTDIDSQRFRYSTTTRGDSSHKFLTQLDLIALRQLNHELTKALEAIEDQLCDKLQLEWPPTT